MSADEWKADDDSRARADAELALVDKMHARKPTCQLCGQRVNRLDEFGLCSKVSGSHMRFRETGRAS